MGKPNFCVWRINKSKNELIKSSNQRMVENSDFIKTSVCGGCKHVHWSQASWVYILDRPQSSCVTLDKYLTSLCLTSLTDKMWDNNIISINCLLVSFGCVTNNPQISMAYNLYIHFPTHGFLESAEVLLGLVMISKSWLRLQVMGCSSYWLCFFSFSMDQQFSRFISLIRNQRSIGRQAKSAKHTKAILKRHTADISLAKVSHTTKSHWPSSLSTERCISLLGLP